MSDVMPEYYKGEQLIPIKSKEGGKNKGAADGFYENSHGRYFVKKPKDKRELFAELFAGLILQEFIKRGLIDSTYASSLIVADWIQFEDGSYGLIQPMVSFNELHKVIGTSTRDGKDRSVLKEVFSGPKHYARLIEQQQYFGLSMALMLSLLLGAHSSHSGNVVARNNKKWLGKQYARLDWGDAFRNFAHPMNNKDLLYPYETMGFNYKKFTKNYFLNYKLIPQLFSTMADKARGFLGLMDSNKVSMEDILSTVLKKIPPDFLNAQEKQEFANYIYMDSFKSVVFGEPKDDHVDEDVGEHGERRDEPDKSEDVDIGLVDEELAGNKTETFFVQEMAELLNTRLEQITKINDVQSSNKRKAYKSIIELTPLSLSMREESFPELLNRWCTAINDSPDLVIETSEVNLSQLAFCFNDYVNQLAAQTEQLNLWQHEPLSTENIFGPLKAGKNLNEKFGDAFVSQYKESTLIRRLFTLDLDSGEPSSFTAYESGLKQYVSSYPDLPWLKLQTLMEAGQKVVSHIRQIQNADKSKFELKDKGDIKRLHQELHNFINAKSAFDILLTSASATNQQATTPGNSFFYPIDATSLKQMTRKQLLIICMEELNHRKPSPLIAQIINDANLWDKVQPLLDDPEFYEEYHFDKEKVAKIREWRQLVDKRASVQVNIDPTEKLHEQSNQLRMILDEFRVAQEGLFHLKIELEQWNKQFERAQSEEHKWNKQNNPPVDARMLLQEQIFEKERKISKLTLRLNDALTREADENSFLQAVNESQKAQERYEQAIKDDQSIQYARTLNIIPVLTQILALEEKAKELEDREEQTASKAANTLVSKINSAVQQYIDCDKSEAEALTRFKEDASKSIQTAERDLGEHREKWKYIMANVSLAVLLVGIGYLAAMCINKGVNKRFTFFSNTQSQDKLGELQKSIDNTAEGPQGTI